MNIPALPGSSRLHLCQVGQETSSAQKQRSHSKGSFHSLRREGSTFKGYYKGIVEAMYQAYMACVRSPFVASQLHMCSGQYYW